MWQCFYKIYKKVSTRVRPEKVMDLKVTSFIQKFLTQPRAGPYCIWAPQRLMKLMMTNDTVKCVLEFIIVVLFLMPVYLNVYEDFGGTWGGWLFVLKIIFIFLSLLNGGLDNDWIWGLIGDGFILYITVWSLNTQKIRWKRLIFLLVLAYCFINHTITIYDVIVSCIR